MVKKCKDCNIIKPYLDFCADKTMKDGYLNFCRKCDYIRREKRRLEDHRTHKICTKCKLDKKISNFDRGQFYCKECRGGMKNRFHEWYDLNPWYRSYSAARKRCKTGRNRPGTKFMMTIEDFKFLWFRDKAYEMDNPSIDRINTFGHYELNNCRYLELKENMRRNKYEITSI